MYRGKKIIYTAHCVLNQNAVIRKWARAQGAFNDIIRVLLDYNISIVQLPCPEFIFSGEARPPKSKSEYDIPEYRRVCRELAEKVFMQMKEYLNNGYQIIGLLGINRSPSCDTVGEKGIFMEELLKLINDENLQLDLFDIPEEYIEGETTETVGELKAFIEKSLIKSQN